MSPRGAVARVHPENWALPLGIRITHQQKSSQSNPRGDKMCKYTLMRLRHRLTPHQEAGDGNVADKCRGAVGRQDHAVLGEPRPLWVTGTFLKSRREVHAPALPVLPGRMDAPILDVPSLPGLFLEIAPELKRTAIPATTAHWRRPSRLPTLFAGFLLTKQPPEL